SDAQVAPFCVAWPQFLLIALPFPPYLTTAFLAMSGTGQQDLPACRVTSADRAQTRARASLKCHMRLRSGRRSSNQPRVCRQTGLVLHADVAFASMGAMCFLEARDAAAIWQCQVSGDAMPVDA